MEKPLPLDCSQDANGNWACAYYFYRASYDDNAHALSLNSPMKSKFEHNSGVYYRSFKQDQRAKFAERSVIVVAFLGAAVAGVMLTQRAHLLQLAGLWASGATPVQTASRPVPVDGGDADSSASRAFWNKLREIIETLDHSTLQAASSSVEPVTLVAQTERRIAAKQAALNSVFALDAAKVDVRLKVLAKDWNAWLQQGIELERFALKTLSGEPIRGSWAEVAGRHAEKGAVLKIRSQKLATDLGETYEQNWSAW